MSDIKTNAASSAPRPLHELHGYAIVSGDGMIADASNTMPAELKNERDWAYFQTELNLCQLVLVGRRSHEAAPSTGKRRRVVMSRSASSLEFRNNVWWWNPQALTLSDALLHLLPEGGRVAVPGGQAVFDLLAQLKAFHTFHLSCVVGLKLPGGHPAFSAQTTGASLASILLAQGLKPHQTQVIDPSPLVTLQLWQRQAESNDSA